MDIEMTGAGVVAADDHERLTTASDEVLLRVTDRGDVQVTEYRSTDREGPPAHTHLWHEIEYVIEGEVEFLLDGEWRRAGPGAVQVLPAGSAHSVRVPEGEARILMVTMGAPYDGFARDLAALDSRGGANGSELVAAAARHGVHLPG
jgi:quercetin dioxygenase-like cupin family protein